MSNIPARLAAAGFLALLSGCAPTLRGGIPLINCRQIPPDPVRQAAEKAALARYEAAAAHTEDGSRAYSYFWLPVRVAGRSSGWLQLLVAPDGSAVLDGSVPAPVQLSAADVGSFEDAVQAAGFPDFPGVEPMICTDGAPASFDAAIGGRRGGVVSNPCGVFAGRVSDAIDQLEALAKSHGGILNRELPMMVCDVDEGRGGRK
ncbi:hypothetical protein QO010_002761 [Caulobacter ginsengisoli]|uniref:Lipoprotein n=1 Tax=Caulobacter ginsengisoli TaxID=400775 RepID=A0ABU0ISJ6_9CAUL|nr:hypothetical protein [Caulobacter ginsengisoli]MDQ0464977.1 hypothetical protein [Caulobacter ginsengisoli]